MTARKSTKSKVDPVDYEAMTRVELLCAARDDHRALKQASSTGKPIPATPALDEFHRRYEVMTSTKSRASMRGKNETGKADSTPRVKARTDIRYFHDGRSMSEGHKSKLSTVAYFYSGNIDGTKPRLSTKEFTAVLNKLGIKDPGQPGWMIELPNGITIECRLDKDKPQFKGEPKARAAKATAPTKKATAPRKASTTKPAAKKAVKGPKEPAGRTRADARSRQVTPIPKKGQGAKKTTAKKAVAAKATRRTVRK